MNKVKRKIQNKIYQASSSSPQITLSRIISPSKNDVTLTKRTIKIVINQKSNPKFNVDNLSENFHSPTYLTGLDIRCIA